MCQVTWDYLKICFILHKVIKKVDLLEFKRKSASYLLGILQYD